jgi:hypothetical protein
MTNICWWLGGIVGFEHNWHILCLVWCYERGCLHNRNNLFVRGWEEWGQLEGGGGICGILHNIQLSYTKNGFGEEVLPEEVDHFLKPKIPPLLLLVNAGLDFGGDGLFLVLVLNSLVGWSGGESWSRWSIDSPVVAAI